MSCWDTFPPLHVHVCHKGVCLSVCLRSRKGNLSTRKALLKLKISGWGRGPALTAAVHLLEFVTHKGVSPAKNRKEFRKSCAKLMDSRSPVVIKGSERC